MNISELNPIFSDIVNSRIFPTDTWQEYHARYGTAHKRILSGYNGEKPRLLKPSFVAEKFKNRLFRSATVVIDENGKIKTYDAHYGKYSADGYTIRYTFNLSGSTSKDEITRLYRV